MPLDKDLLENVYVLKITSDYHPIYAVGHFVITGEDDADFVVIDRKCVTSEGMGNIWHSFFSPAKRISATRR